MQEHIDYIVEIGSFYSWRYTYNSTHYDNHSARDDAHKTAFRFKNFRSIVDYPGYSTISRIPISRIYLFPKPVTRIQLSRNGHFPEILIFPNAIIPNSNFPNGH
jgi:hypothetical protein